jgi:hypothetical protein
VPAPRAWPQVGLGFGGGPVVRTAVGADEVGPGFRPPGTTAGGIPSTWDHGGRDSVHLGPRREGFRPPGTTAGGEPAQPATASSSRIVAPREGKCTAPPSRPCAGMSAVRIRILHRHIVRPSQLSRGEARWRILRAGHSRTALKSAGSSCRNERIRRREAGMTLKRMRSRRKFKKMRASEPSSS